jgi:excisionase family DNA binding protein
MKVGLSLREAAEYLGVSYITAHRYAKDGTIPSVKIGSRRIFHPEILERFLKGQLHSSGAVLTEEKSQ